MCQREGESVKYFERSWLEGELLPPSSIDHTSRHPVWGDAHTRCGCVGCAWGTLALWHTLSPSRPSRDPLSPRTPRSGSGAAAGGGRRPAARPGRAAGGRVMTDHGAHGSVPREPVGGWARGDARNARRLYDPVYRNETHVY